MTHHLVVEDLGDSEFNRYIEHSVDCPKQIVDEGPLFGQYTCGVGYWESSYGLEDLEEDPRYTTPGRHEITFYSYTPTSMFEEAEAYLEYVDE